MGGSRSCGSGDCGRWHLLSPGLFLFCQAVPSSRRWGRLGLVVRGRPRVCTPLASWAGLPRTSHSRCRARWHSPQRGQFAISSPRRPQLMQYPRRGGRGHARRLCPCYKQLKQWPPGGSRTGSTAKDLNPPKMTPVTLIGRTEGSAVAKEVEAVRVADGVRRGGVTGLPAGDGKRDCRLRRSCGS